MKHLKLFNESYDESLYNEINLFEFQANIDRTSEDLTNSEKNWISKYNNQLIVDATLRKWSFLKFKSDKIYYSIYPDVDYIKSFFSIYWSYTMNPKEVFYGNRLIQCFKLEDEYFICQLPYKIFNALTYRFFICDTFDGVINLLKDFEIILA